MIIAFGVHTTKFDSSRSGGWELSVRSKQQGVRRTGLGSGVGEIMLSVA